MKIPYYHVDAFTSNRFAGNPAGVCVLDTWLPDEVLQQIAFENNLSETAFLVPRPTHYDLRWFTPAVEVDLCGHATLASAFVIFNYLGYTEKQVSFQTQSGLLAVARQGNLLVMDFPARPPEACQSPAALSRGLGREPEAVGCARDFLAVFPTAADVVALQPDFQQLAQVDSLGVIVTAPGEDVDFVSRFFAPRVGINEDPVTGSAHCTLIPYWAERLSKTKLTARQLSRRGGELTCELVGDRVKIGGQAVIYFKGELEI